jgi:RNA polymerase sigma factor (sigma-70 family)|tara:strand:+ start:545 stop:1306 length:762 start_codon:yes stop_codon:yes gene_type:complete
MKNYNIQNYIRYKKDLEESIKLIDRCRPWDEFSRDELITIFMPLVENIARKFATSQQASGVMSILDLIQEGNLNLTIAVDKIVWETIYEAEDPEKRLKSFLSKRIKGGIRRAIDKNRGNMRLPEHVINDIRKDFGKDKKAVAMFFNSIFLSIDAKIENDNNLFLEIEDKQESYNKILLNSYLLSLLKQHLNIKEYDVLRLSYGLDCKKHTAKEIAEKLNIKGSGAYVRVSQLKKQAINKLIENVDHSQVIDFL